MTTTKTVLIAALGLAALAVCCPAPGGAQVGSSKEEQTFDYDPGAGKETPKIQESAAETTYEDAEIINHPIYGTIILSKHRWKSWVARALYLALINIALIAITLSLSRAEEYALIVSYMLSGANFTLSFWVFLCAVLLFQLNSNSWLYVLPVSFVMAVISYVVLLKTKRSDVSMSELKESFKKMRANSHEDPRLISVDGSPGDWQNEDFIR